MRNHTCLLDHHQRSHYDTITIGPEGMMNWVPQLNNSQSVNSFDSLVEKFNTKRSPNQPNQNPNQCVIDRGNLIAQKMCLLLKVKSPVPTRSMKNVCTKNLFLQIDQGNLIICLKTPVKQTHDGTRQRVEQNSSRMHTVKEQFAPEDNRDIASFNTDNEFNRAINEENIDFNVPGLPHSAVKRSHGHTMPNLGSGCAVGDPSLPLYYHLHQQFVDYGKTRQAHCLEGSFIRLCVCVCSRVSRGMHLFSCSRSCRT